jgi:hypothetical protein
MTNRVTAIGRRAITPARNVRKMRPKPRPPAMDYRPIGPQSFAARMPRVNRLRLLVLADAFQRIGGGHLAQEVYHRVAELLGLAR